MRSEGLTELRLLVISGLRDAARAHSVGRFDQVGVIHDRLESEAAQQGVTGGDLRIAIDFLDSWSDSSNHGWALYEPLRSDDWPRLGSQLASDLEAGAAIDPWLREQFTFVAPSEFSRWWTVLVLLVLFASVVVGLYRVIGWLAGRTS